MATKTIKACDLCSSDLKVTEVPHPLTDEVTDRCPRHMPCSYAVSMSGTDWSGPYTSSRFDDIDVELRLVRPGVVRILVDEEDFGEVTAEQVAELAVLSKPERTVGPFQVTSRVSFDGPLEVDFDVDLLVRFMGHDFTTGEFEG